MVRAVTCFLPAALHVSGLGVPDAWLKNTSVSSSALSEVNQFHRCKLLGEARDLLMPEVSSFRSSLSPHLALLSYQGWTVPVSPLQLRSRALEAGASLRRSCLFLFHVLWWCCTACSLPAITPALNNAALQRQHTYCRTEGQLSRH